MLPIARALDPKSGPLFRVEIYRIRLFAPRGPKTVRPVASVMKHHPRAENAPVLLEQRLAWQSA